MRRRSQPTVHLVAERGALAPLVVSTLSEHCSRVGLRQRSVEVGAYVVGIFDADRNSDQVSAHAGLAERIVVELGVCGRRRMDHERSRVADIREMATQLARVDEAAACFAPTNDTEREYRTGSLG